MPVVLNSGLRVKAKPQNMCHHSAIDFFLKSASKGPETEKMFGLSRDWAHSWAGCFFDRNVPQLLTAVPYLPSAPVASTHCKGLTKADIHKQSTYFEFPNGVRLISLKSHFDTCLECKVTVFSKLNSLYLPYVQGLFMMKNNGNFPTCTCSRAAHAGL